jgi:actin-like protein 6A
VLDVGTHSVKAGYAGDDTPKAVFPSACGVVVDNSGAEAGSGAVKKGAKKAGSGGEDADMADKDDANKKQANARGGNKVHVGADGPSFRRDHMEVLSPFGADGQVHDWDLAEALWRHALSDRLRVTDPADMALLVVEPTHATKASRERCVERLFESVACPAAYLTKAALLACFATAKQTGVVVDAGHMATTGE